MVAEKVDGPVDGWMEVAEWRHNCEVVEGGATTAKTGGSTSTAFRVPAKEKLSLWHRAPVCRPELCK